MLLRRGAVRRRTGLAGWPHGLRGARARLGADSLPAPRAPPPPPPPPQVKQQRSPRAAAAAAAEKRCHHTQPPTRFPLVFPLSERGRALAPGAATLGEPCNRNPATPLGARVSRRGRRGRAHAGGGGGEAAPHAPVVVVARGGGGQEQEQCGMHRRAHAAAAAPTLCAVCSQAASRSARIALASLWVCLVPQPTREVASRLGPSAPGRAMRAASLALAAGPQVRASHP